MNQGLRNEMEAVNVSRLCNAVNMSRWNWYKGQKTRKRRQVDEDMVEHLVKQERKMQPRLGGRKLYEVLKPDFRELDIFVGRDRLFEILRKKDLLVPPLPKSCRTTDSAHCLPVFYNLIKDLVVTHPNQVWVSDITYLRTEEGFVYLSTIMDLYSRKIVGYHCGDTLESVGCIEALENALSELPQGSNPIHHSDRGCQYCCHEYVKRLKARDMPISMTEENHCAENAHAERLNGTLKGEYALGMTFKNAAHAKETVEQGVYLYNNRRPHKNLKMCRPAEVHRQAA